MTALLTYLQSIRPLPDGLPDFLHQIVQRKLLVPKAYLLREGDVCDEVYFIQRGLLRCFARQGRTEVCSWFMKEGDVCIAVESWFRQVQSRENIQALERTEVYSISWRQLQEIYERYPAFNFTGRVLTEKYYLQSEQRLAAMRLRRSHERYRWLMESSPELLLRVPAKHLASYLGMSEVMLSNIRSRR
ncbi:MAG: Crp/Fnr family transcriptional regulator [Bacteroidota bacterium]|nr:Crp/Fnr family transcriptional regulator [Bacteroidota bacterium]MDP4248451.1 Crp/Fnr family transcriptional regulator [Bacteroidota bacterium]